VPAGVVGQVWRDGRKQARLARLFAADELAIEALDDRRAREAGQLCGVTATADVIDAAVVLGAKARPSDRDVGPEGSRAFGAGRRIDRRLTPRQRWRLSVGASALAIDDEAAGRIVRRDRDGDPVTEHHADPVAADLARELGQHLVAVVELDPKVTAFRDQDDLAVEMN
jgi:hypothetical protein